MVEDRSILINAIELDKNQREGGSNDGTDVVDSKQQVQGERVPLHP